MPDHPLTLLTIRLSLVCYAAVLGGYAAGWFGQARLSAARMIWTLGCGLFLAHAASAFHFYHGWSNAHAVADTARQTRELLGWEFGEGIYFSYLFAVVWTLDVAWWWADCSSYEQRRRWVALAIHGYLLFIVINGALVFEDGAVRWVGVAACIVVGILGVWRLARSNNLGEVDAGA